MPKRTWSWVAVALAAALAACSNNNLTGPVPQVTLGNPDSLTYVLLPAAPGTPLGVLLSWVPATDPNVTDYVVYVRDSSAGTWGVLAYTGTTTYFDSRPGAQYYVASEDQVGDISSGTSPITVDTAPPLGPPGGLAGTGIDSGAKLTWSDSVRLNSKTLFSYYRVYSEPATVSGGTNSCPTGSSAFGLEGTTVSENFVVTGIANGTPVCYAVTSVTGIGQESALSAWLIVTPSASGGGFDIASHPGVTVVLHRTGIGAKAVKR